MEESGRPVGEAQHECPGPVHVVAVEFLLAAVCASAQLWSAIHSHQRISPM